MRSEIAVLIGLALVAAGCSKNDNPTAPTDSNATTLTRIYVNPASGLDSNPGTDASPLKTIRKALLIAQTGQHVELQAGTYDAASGQIYPDTIPSGVTVEAVSAGLAVLVGSGPSAFVGTGNDTTRYLSVQGFQTMMQASSGTHVVISMKLANTGYAFQLSSNAQALMTDCTLTSSGVASLTDIAQATVIACTISGTPSDDYISLRKAASLVMSGSTLSNSMTTCIDMYDVSTATLTGCVVSKVSLQGAGGSSSIDLSSSARLTLRSTNVNGAYGPAVLMRDAGTTVVAVSSYFYGNATGVNGYPVFWQSAGNLSIDSCSISGGTSNGFALQNGSLSLRNSTVQSMKGDGISASSGTSLYVRNTTISSCLDGIYVGGTSGYDDLGTATSPGGNTITNNSSFGLDDRYSGAVTVYAVGNIWTASVQGANANGQYGGALVSGPVNNGSPANYLITSNGAKIQF